MMEENTFAKHVATIATFSLPHNVTLSPTGVWPILMKICWPLCGVSIRGNKLHVEVKNEFQFNQLNL